MRRILTGVVVLLMGLAAAGTARADHPHPLLRPHANDDGEAKSKHRLWPFAKYHQHDDCEAKSPHRLWPFSGHKLFGGHGSGHKLFGGHAHGQCKECGYHPWFNTYKGCPDPCLAFPVHPFARSPRDFFMYEW